MTRKLIVHAGMPRAGSSTLQEVLFHYRDRLEPQSLLYPALSAEAAGTGERAQLYNHKLLLQSAKAFWPPGRFARLHSDIARQIEASNAGRILLSYEGWWDPRNIAGLGKTVGFLENRCPDLETTIAAIVREPASFLLSLYKLDVLHGRTGALFTDYWPGKLSDPRLRYHDIGKALAARFGAIVMLDFEAMTRDGRLVADVLSSMGADGILARAGVPALEHHRSKGGNLFTDASVTMALFAARKLGLKCYGEKRKDVIDIITRLAAEPDLAGELNALMIPLGAAACQAIAAATRPQTDAFASDFGVRLEMPEPRGDELAQSLIAEQSQLGQALLAELTRLG